MPTYYADKELPGQGFTLYDQDGETVLPLLTGWTGSVLLVVEGEPDHIIRTQTENIALTSTAPNFTRQSWAAATLAAVVAYMSTAGVYTLDVLELPVIARAGDGADEVFGRDNAVRHVFKAAPTT